MDIEKFFEGLIIGFLIAVPVGPIAVLCIHRTLARGKLAGIVSGLGAATADAAYGAVAAFGLTYISDFMIAQEIWFRLIGAVFLCCLGVKTYLTRTAEEAGQNSRLSHAGNYWSTLLLTLMNPMTILAFGAVFAGLGISNKAGYSVIPLIVGVFTGSSLWWLILCGITNLFGEKIGQSNLVWLNKISGIVITSCGLFILLSLIM